MLQKPRFFSESRLESSYPFDRISTYNSSMCNPCQIRIVSLECKPHFHFLPARLAKTSRNRELRRLQFCAKITLKSKPLPANAYLYEDLSVADMLGQSLLGSGRLETPVILIRLAYRTFLFRLAYRTFLYLWHSKS